MPVDSRINLSSEVPAETDWKDVQGMQQTLQDRGRYHGKIDGVFGLRTRASIRGFQKAENLPATGQLDVRTASKLGVRSESREDTGYATTQGSRRSSKTLPKPNEK